MYSELVFIFVNLCVRSQIRPHLTVGADDRSARLWELMGTYIPDGQSIIKFMVCAHFFVDPETIEHQLVNHVEYTLCRTRYNFDNFAAYQATAYR